MVRTHRGIQDGKIGKKGKTEDSLRQSRSDLPASEGCSGLAVLLGLEGNSMKF